MALKIALIGYGKMGSEIEKAAEARGHTIALKLTSQNRAEQAGLKECDIAVEFTRPEAVFDNIMTCFNAGIPVVVGTTGWNHRQKEAEDQCRKKNGTLLYSSNFSIGVNVFFELNRTLARLMKDRKDYDVSIEETHHVNKIDRPSGTAITLAEQVIENMPGKKKWSVDNMHSPESVSITSIRQDLVVGTHTVCYRSAVDEISITHKANNRSGFAMGAVMAAEFLAGKKGVYSMKDVLAI